MSSMMMEIDPNNVAYLILQGQCPNPACLGKAPATSFRNSGTANAPKIFVCEEKREGCGFWWQPERGSKRLYSWNPARTYRDFIDVINI